MILVRLRNWGPALLVAAVCLLPFWGLWIAPGAPMEEGFMLVFPELVMRGEVPNEDFLHLYGPGSLWVLAGVFRIFGVTLEAERAVGFLQQVGVAFGVFVLVRPWGRWLAAVGGAVAALIIVPPIGLVALAWVGAVALGLWAIVAGLRAIDAGAGADDEGRKRRAIAACGLLAGAALLYRPDLVLAVGAAGAVVALGLAPRDRRRLAVWFALGVSPILVHLAMAGIGNAVEGMFLEPVFDLRGGRRLPLPPSWNEFDGFLQRAGVLSAPPWPIPAPPSPAQLSLWLGLILAADAALLAAGVRRFRSSGDRRLLVMALFAVGLLPQALQRADSTHLAWVSCVPLGFAPAAVWELTGRLAPLRRRVVALASVPLLLLLLVPHFSFRQWGDYVAQTFGVHRQGHTIERDGRRFYYGRAEVADAVTALLADIGEFTEPGDGLIVGTADLRKTPYSEAFLYYLLPELPPATRYIEMDPGVANAPDSGLADEIRAADVLILSSIRDDWVEPNDSREFGPNEPNEVVEQEFCLRGSYGEGLFGRGLYELWTRC